MRINFSGALFFFKSRENGFNIFRFFWTTLNDFDWAWRQTISRHHQHLVQQNFSRGPVFSPRQQPRLLPWIWPSYHGYDHGYVIERPISAQGHTQQCWKNEWNDIWNESYIELRIYFIYHFISWFIHHGNIRTHKRPAPNVSGFIAQLVRASHQHIARSRAQISWSPEVCKPLYSISKIAFVTARIISSLECWKRVQLH